MKLKYKKLIFSIIRPRLWPSLANGVAPSIEHYNVLKKLKYNYLLDVGANKGQFALLSNIINPNAKIICFEPIATEFRLLKKCFNKNRNVKVIETAIGDYISETVTLHLSRKLDSSSLLPIGKNQTLNFPGTDEYAIVKVPITTIDHFLSSMHIHGDILLKIDVQGYELPVLKGAIKTLTKIKYILVECSFIELYEGQALFPEIDNFLRTMGFTTLLSDDSTFNPKKDLIQSDILYKNNKY